MLSLDKIKHKEEYELVENQFMINNYFGGTVSGIQRIQNIDLFENYYFARRRVLEKYDHTALGLSEDNLNSKWYIENYFIQKNIYRIQARI